MNYLPRMATPAPLPQRETTRRSRRLRGQNTLSPKSPPAEVVGSAATPPRGVAPFRGSASIPTAQTRAKWWKNHQNELPAWAEAYKLVLLVQPSSDAAERVFSLLEKFLLYIFARLHLSLCHATIQQQRLICIDVLF